MPCGSRGLAAETKDFQQLLPVMVEGRDMGVVVFADTDKKVFLTASSTERHERGFKQLKEKGIDANLDRITGDWIAVVSENDRFFFLQIKHYTWVHLTLKK